MSVFHKWQKIGLLFLLMLFGASSAPAMAVFNIGDFFGRGTIRGGGIGQYSQLSQLITPLIWNVYVITGSMVLFVLLYGGFMIIMGAGQSDAKKVDQGKQAVTWGLAGLVVVFVSFWLIRIIEVLTGLQIVTGGNL